MPPLFSKPRLKAHLRLATRSLVLIVLLLATATAAVGETNRSHESARDLYERARAAKQTARAPLLPQTRYTVRKKIESIEPISWLERYGKVRIRERER